MRIKKYVVVLLAIIMTLQLLVSCGFKGDDKHTSNTNGTSETNHYIDSDIVAGYTVVVPDSADIIIVDAATRLRDILFKITGEYRPILIDTNQASDDEAKEILVGITNRKESLEAKNKIAENGFAIEKNGNKIAIVSTNIYIIGDAIDSFISSYIENGNNSVKEFWSVDNTSYISESYGISDIVKDKTAKYVVVYPAGMITQEVTSTAIKIVDKIGALTGIYLPMITDNEMKPDGFEGEILIGWTNRKETDEVLKTLKANEYAITVNNKNIVIAGLSRISFSKAVDEFLDVIENNAIKKVGVKEELSLFNPSLKFNYNKRWITDIPEYEGGKLSGVYDANDDTYQKYITGTNAADFKAYRTKLEKEGFVLFDENAITGNEFATYIKGETLIHCYYVKYLDSVRIIVSPLGNLPGKKNDNNYTKITDTLVTNVALDYDNSAFGLGIVIRLEDSSFIIIDGGIKNTTDAEKIYNLLQTQNAAGGKPVIAAWIMTHTHADHKGIFELFARDYSSQVVLEMFICNSVAESESPYSRNPDYYMDTKFKDDIKAFGKNVKIVKPHTGQRFYIRNAEFEVLYTHEDLYPTTMTYFNDSTTVMRMVANGQSFMWLGDVEHDGSNVISAMYGNYIKSDFVQVSHHGERGGTIQLYSLINPSVAIWATELVRYNRVKTSEVNSHLINALNVKEHIISGYGTRTIQLPYTPNP